MCPGRLLNRTLIGFVDIAASMPGCGAEGLGHRGLRGHSQDVHVEQGTSCSEQVHQSHEGAVAACSEFPIGRRSGFHALVCQASFLRRPQSARAPYYFRAVSTHCLFAPERRKCSLQGGRTGHQV